MAVFNTGKNKKSNPKKFGKDLKSKVDRKQLIGFLKSKKFLIGSVVSIFLVIIVAGTLFYLGVGRDTMQDDKDKQQQVQARPARFDPDNVFDLAGSYNKRCAYETEEVRGVCNLTISQDGSISLTLPDETEHTGRVEVRREGDNLFNVYWDQEDDLEKLTVVEAKREGTTIKMYYQSGQVFGFNTF
jgi:hypothetical protein